MCFLFFFQGIKEHSCDHCSYMTSMRAHLKKHIKSVHEQLRDQACHLCQYRASTKGSLDRHIR